LIALTPIFAGCTVTLYAKKSAQDPEATRSYRMIWARDWNSINQASTPWNGSNGNPGACDIGGSRIGCYRTDRAVFVGLINLTADLRSHEVPASYVPAHRALLAALTTEIKGLNDRDVGLSAPGHAASFSTGVAELREASGELNAAYVLFPADDRPLPALFGAGRHCS
jgi:hypothetical protein